MTLSRPTEKERRDLLKAALVDLNDKECGDLFDIIDDLFDLALTEDALLNEKVDNPIEHHTTVLKEMMHIAKGEKYKFEEIRRAAAISILHDIYPVQKITRQMRREAKTPEEKAKLELKNLEYRIVHMGEGSIIARKLLRTLNEKRGTNVFSNQDIDEICSVIAIHDVPSINVGIPGDAKMAVAFREADRLWMLTCAGVKADLARNGIHRPTHEQCVEQVYKNLKSYRKERALYFSNSERFHDCWTFFRTLTGYNRFSELYKMWFNKKPRMSWFMNAMRAIYNWPKWDKLLPLLITTFIALAGWFVVDLLSSKRDQENKRRELRVQHLLESYQNLMDAACYYKIEGKEKTFRLVTKASANIQLFGSDKQIQMDCNYTKGYAAGETVSLTELLENLRSDLREELSLPVTNQKLHWFEVKKKNQEGIPVNSEQSAP